MKPQAATSVRGPSGGESMITRRMRRGRRGATALLAATALLSACATAPPTERSDLAGEWTGELDPAETVPGGQRLPLGQVHLRLSQNGRDVSGRFTGQGFQGEVHGAVLGTSVTGEIAGRTLSLAFNRPFQATVSGPDTLSAVLGAGAPFTLTRAADGPARPVTLQNPRTLQVLSCRGSVRAIESCVASLEIDGWKRLGP
jgi:hypothetical protein